VDNIVERLSRHKDTAKRIVRVGHPARLLPEVLAHSLDSVVGRSDIGQSCALIRKDMNQQLQLMRRAKSRDDRYAARNELRLSQKDLRTREKNAVSEALKSCRVVLSTLTGAASDSVVKNAPYDLVIIDEVAQSTEVACLIPILLGRRLVLAGDHHQLGPTIKSDEAARDGLNITLFDRLMHLYGAADVGNNDEGISTLLTIQYRMHSTICKWSSDELYHSKLIADTSVATHLLSDLPNVTSSALTQSPFVLIDTTACNMYEDDPPSNDSDDVKSLISDSKSNKEEAAVVSSISSI
jgi:superfamily I DNA and/or RNA helicase